MQFAFFCKKYINITIIIQHGIDNIIITSNEIHLLVLNTDKKVIEFMAFCAPLPFWRVFVASWKKLLYFYIKIMDFLVGLFCLFAKHRFSQSVPPFFPY